MYTTLDGVIPINIINVYMPTSVYPEEEKEKQYSILQDTYNKLKNKGPTYIVGDFNARLIYPCNEAEEQIMGKFTMFENKKK